MNSLINSFSMRNENNYFLFSGAKVLFFFEIYKYYCEKMTFLCTNPYTLCI